MSKLIRLAHDYGFGSVHDMLEAATFDNIVPGICTNKSCNYSTDVEPDSADGWCEECSMNSVKSCLRLAGII